MNLSLLSLELAVVAVGLALLLAALWVNERWTRPLGWLAAAALGLVLWWSFGWEAGASPASGAAAPPQFAFGQSCVVDGLALFFKRFFLVAAGLVLILAAEFAGRLKEGLVEYYALVLFALAGMMAAASAHHFAVLFVSLELITVTFYVLTSFQRRRLQSLEAGAKYLILGALSSAFLIYGIALVFGTSGTMDFGELAKRADTLASKPIFQAGLLLIFAGLGFKIAAVPFQFWAPDVYQGAPAPTVAFLAVGSKAAGFVLLLRLFQAVVPAVAQHWTHLLVVLAGATILYGNLGALPQRNLKRLLGYSSIANAGYLLMGVAAMTQAGSAALLFYLGGYLFTVLAAFAVIGLILTRTDLEDFGSLAGLNERAPFAAAVMTLAMVSLAGVPPLAGFFGKFLLVKAVIERGAVNPAFYGLAGVAIVGVVISLYYYFGVIRAMYWAETTDREPIPISWPNRMALAVCAAGMLYLGILPGWLVEVATRAVSALKL